MTIGAVILAAGASSRMGRPKQTLRVGGQSLLRGTVLAALGAGCAPVVVVTGASADQSRGELEGLDVQEAFNPHWESGMASSIRAGISLLREADAVVLMVCDQPHVTSAVVLDLIEAHLLTGSPVVASSYGASSGVPALFARSLYGELERLQGAAGAKPVIERCVDAHFIAFPEGAVDLDTLEDLQRFADASGA